MCGDPRATDACSCPRVVFRYKLLQEAHMLIRRLDPWTVRMTCGHVGVGQQTYVCVASAGNYTSLPRGTCGEGIRCTAGSWGNDMHTTPVRAAVHTAGAVLPPRKNGLHEAGVSFKNVVLPFPHIQIPVFISEPVTVHSIHADCRRHTCCITLPAHSQVRKFKKTCT